MLNYTAAKYEEKNRYIKKKLDNFAMEIKIGKTFKEGFRQ